MKRFTLNQLLGYFKFKHLYEKLLVIASSTKAPYYLAGLSLSEAIFFPIPPDVMLAPMVLTQPQHAWRYAGLTTLSSLVGGLIGYSLGMFLLTIVNPWFQFMGYETTYLQVQQWFLIWGFWIILLAGFTPIPYKIFTMAAGASAMPLLTFLVASLIGRGLRFYLVSGLIKWKGRSTERILLPYIERIGWVLVISFIIYVGYKYFTTHA